MERRKEKKRSVRKEEGSREEVKGGESSGFFSPNIGSAPSKFFFVVVTNPHVGQFLIWGY
jgi:hypothetical protein